MLHLTLIRKWKKSDYTIGQLFAGGRMICNTVEDADRNLNMYMSEKEINKIKIAGETAIPVGTYKLAVTQSPRFGRKLIEVLNEDSAGCILPGNNTEKGKVTNSTKFEELLTSMVDGAISNGEEAYLTII